jgi:anti-sigma regulatory factor (Ser/Thr protein kinase)
VRIGGIRTRVRSLARIRAHAPRARSREPGHGRKGNGVDMADLQEATVTLPSEPASVTTARRYVCALLGEWGLPPGDPAMDPVRLMVSELATNAVLHTSGQSPTFTVEVRLEHGEELHIGVTDSHPCRPRQLPAAAQQDHGRGMMIICHLAAESGGSLQVTPTDDGGKTVWIRIPWAVPVP